MNKICTKMAEILFANKPKVHFVLPKSLNLYFHNSVNPELKFINLTNIANIEFSLKEDKDSNVFSVVAHIVYKNATATEMVVSKFRDQKDALNALTEIRVKLYAPANSLGKLALSIVVAILVFGMAEGFFTNISNSSTLNPSVPEQTIETKPVAQAPLATQPLLNFAQSGIGSSEETQALIEQLQTLKALQDKSEMGESADIQPGETVQPPQEQELSPSDKLLQGLN